MKMKKTRQYTLDLPEWARAALDEPLEETPTPSVLDHRGEEAWPLLVEAALVSSFLPRDLAPELIPDHKRSEAESTVLRFAETTYGPNGMQWTLTQQSRCEVVDASISTDALKRAAEDTASRFNDNVSRALRTCVMNPTDTISEVDLNNLEATRIAVASLVGVSREKLKLPPLEKLDREIALRRLLSQFERMIGRRAGEKGSEKNDRFFGRKKEMEDLKRYVGALGSTSTRMWDRVKRSVVQGRTPLAVWGIGGAGKTTLISKFMLEHTEAASSKFPFAYLDFDRTTIGARQRLDLLAEMCSQVGAQFEELTQPMAQLGAEVSQLARRLESKNQLETVSELGAFCGRFRELVDNYLKPREATFGIGFERPFLLVFDTFEVVQYAQGDNEEYDAIKGLQVFVRAFSRSGESGLWPRLRVIISGRKQVKKFLGDVEELKVGALDPEGSEQLLVALAKDAGRPITDSEATALVQAITKVIKEPNEGVQPLRLHLVGEVFRKAEGGGKGVVESLIDDLSKPLDEEDSPGTEAVEATIMVDGILVRRIIKHVNDPRVQALADPGLVVRRITAEVIEKVMTRGTSRPGVVETTPDAEIVEPWEVTQEEAKDIFKAFRKEITLVEEDSEGLRHRPDVRQQMLPLIRKRRKKRFKLLNKLAFDYFVERTERDPKDLTAAAEAIYHGLWLHEPLERLNKLWRDHSNFKPRIDPNDFDEKSLANVYVRAKAHTSLTADEVKQLPPAVKQEWLQARTIALLEENRVEEIEALREAAGPGYAGVDNCDTTAAALARLFYRAGLWQDAVDLVMRHLKAANESEFVDLDDKEARGGALLSLLRTLATVLGKSAGSPEALQKLGAILPGVKDPLIRVELAAHTIAACKQHGKDLHALSQTTKTMVLLPAAREVTPEQWLMDKKLLRLAILSDAGLVEQDERGGDSLPELIPTWISTSERVPRDVKFLVISNLLTQVFAQGPSATAAKQIVEQLKSQKRSDAFHKLDEFWRGHKAVILEAVQTRSDLRPLMRAVIAADNSDWIRPLGNSFTRACRGEDGPALISALEKVDFRVSSGQRGRPEEADGIAVAQYAMDDGRLLDLAATLQDWQMRNRPRSSVSTSWPQDVFAISRALLEWDMALSLGDQGMSWEDAPHLESKMKRALDSFDWGQVDANCRELITRIKSSKNQIPEATAKRLLSSLRRKTRFFAMAELAAAILASGVRTPQVRRQYAQALIDTRNVANYGEAQEVLKSIIDDPLPIEAEVAEAKGLTARIYKQYYVNDPKSLTAPRHLQRALETYGEVYRQKPSEHLWHGINVVACVARAKRDGLLFESLPDELALAREILATLEEKETQSAVELPAWDEATRMEAYVALGQYRDADATALRYVDSSYTDAFELNSTIRQLEEVWQLNYNEAPGNHLMPILKAAHLSKQGGFSEGDPLKVKEEAVAVGAAALELEQVFGSDRTVTLNWYKKGLDQCNSVARIEKLNNKGVGTGWLVKASDFFPGREGVLVLTNAHVINNDPSSSPAVLPEDAQVNFQALGQKFRVKEVVWSSPVVDLDATLISIDGEPNTAPLVLHSRPVQMSTPSRPAPRLYIIGHPQGRDLEFSLQDNNLLACNERLLHYRTPTEPGSSGSPVFESEDWRVVALHHGGSPKLARLDGGDGTYEANEGIAILAIKQRTQQQTS